MAFSHYHNNTSFLDFRSFDMRISPFFLHSRNSQITVISVADSPAFACGFPPLFPFQGEVLNCLRPFLSLRDWWALLWFHASVQFVEGKPKIHSDLLKFTYRASSAARKVFAPVWRETDVFNSWSGPVIRWRSGPVIRTCDLRRFVMCTSVHIECTLCAHYVRCNSDPFFRQNPVQNNKGKVEKGLLCHFFDVIVFPDFPSWFLPVSPFSQGCCGFFRAICIGGNYHARQHTTNTRQRVLRRNRPWSTLEPFQNRLLGDKLFRRVLILRTCAILHCAA